MSPLATTLYFTRPRLTHSLSLHQERGGPRPRCRRFAFTVSGAP